MFLCWLSWNAILPPEITQVANLQSRYAMRLYEFLIRFKTTKKLEISIEDLRFRFGLLEHEYKAMGDFKKFVLDLAVKQINEHTDITVKYEQHKKRTQYYWLYIHIQV